MTDRNPTPDNPQTESHDADELPSLTQMRWLTERNPMPDNPQTESHDADELPSLTQMRWLTDATSMEHHGVEAD